MAKDSPDAGMAWLLQLEAYAMDVYILKPVVPLATTPTAAQDLCASEYALTGKTGRRPTRPLPMQEPNARNGTSAGAGGYITE